MKKILITSMILLLFLTSCKKITEKRLDDIYLHIGYYKQQNRYDKLLEYLEEQQRYYESRIFKDKEVLLTINETLSQFYEYRGDLTKAIYYGEKAFEIDKNSYSATIRCLLKIHDYKRIKEILHQLSQIPEISPNTQNYISYISALVMIGEGKIAEAEKVVFLKPRELIPFFISLEKGDLNKMEECKNLMRWDNITMLIMSSFIEYEKGNIDNAKSFAKMAEERNQEYLKELDEIMRESESLYSYYLEIFSHSAKARKIFEEIYLKKQNE